MITLQKNKKNGVEIFTDADWARSTEDKRPATGYYTFAWKIW